MNIILGLAVLITAIFFLSHLAARLFSGQPKGLYLSSGRTSFKRRLRYHFLKLKLRRFIVVAAASSFFGAPAFCNGDAYVKKTHNLDLFAKTTFAANNNAVSQYFKALQTALTPIDDNLEEMEILESTFYGRLNWNGENPEGVVDLNGADVLHAELGLALNNSKKALSLIKKLKAPKNFEKSHVRLLAYVQEQHNVFENQHEAYSEFLKNWVKELNGNINAVFPAEDMYQIFRRDRFYIAKHKQWEQLLSLDYLVFTGVRK